MFVISILCFANAYEYYLKKKKNEKTNSTITINTFNASCSRIFAV